MEIVKNLFGSKKFVAALIFIVLMIGAAVLDTLLGVTFTEEQIYGVATVITGYLLAQGAADLGKEKVKQEYSSKEIAYSKQETPIPKAE